MLSEKLGHFFDKPLGRIARNIPLSPNTLTLVGLAVTGAAAVVLAENLFWGGILVFCGAVFDVLDGLVARTKNQQTAFGAFLDSVLDRYSDAAIFSGIGTYCFRNAQMAGVVLCVVALVGSFLTSYARARAEGLGKQCKAGVLERPERILLVIVGAVSGFIIPVLWVLAVLSQLTAIQRILVARKVLNR